MNCTPQPAPMTLHNALLLASPPTEPSRAEDACTLLLATWDATVPNEVFMPVKALRRLLEDLRDEIDAAHWRANTLYEAGWKHLNQTATQGVQP